MIDIPNEIADDKKLVLELFDLHIQFKNSQETLIKIPYLSLSQQENIAIMGASGSGKSTLLSYICGTLNQNFTASGKIILNGKNITDWAIQKRRCGILFQDMPLFPHMNVSQNLLFALPSKFDKKTRLNYVYEALEKAKLQDYHNVNIHTLSGGQKARIALLQTLLSDPEILLLDEPFSSLDKELRKEFIEFVVEHTKTKKLSCLLVSHDIKDVRAMNSKILTMKDKAIHFE